MTIDRLPGRASRRPLGARAAGAVLAGALLVAATSAGAAPAGDLTAVSPAGPAPALPPDAAVGGTVDADRALPATAGVRLALLQVAPRPPLAPSLPGTRLVEPVVLDSAVVSGLPWRSGLACGGEELATWRGRPLDTAWFGTPTGSWDTMRKAAKGASLRSRARQAPQLVVSLPLLPQSESLQHERCAAGEFDGHFREIGAALLANGAGSAVVRLGKEANRGAAPWGYGSAEVIPAYKACFRNAALALKESAPSLKIEWTNGRQTLPPVNPLDAYPGSDVVDIVGVHYYDNPRLDRMTTQATWDRNYVAANPGGGPQGLGTWLAATRELGKKLAVSEWGLWGPKGGVPDDVLYVENMYRFFQENAADIEYESYYNCNLRHQLHPSTRFPNAGARYRELWSSGQ